MGAAPPKDSSTLPSCSPVLLADKQVECVLCSQKVIVIQNFHGAHPIRVEIPSNLDKKTTTKNIYFSKLNKKEEKKLFFILSECNICLKKNFGRNLQLRTKLTLGSRCIECRSGAAARVFTQLEKCERRPHIQSGPIPGKCSFF